MASRTAEARHEEEVGENGEGSDFIAFNAGARFPLHDHEGPGELIMLSGMIRFGDIVVSAGDCLQAGPGDVHDAEALDDSVFLISHVGGPVLKGDFQSKPTVKTGSAVITARRAYSAE
ncbi:MAG: hypothetical protein ABIU05_15350 [Nitrospirales bacterium]